MVKRKNRMREWLTRTLEVPPDVMMDLPRITMIGRLHIYIENHKGLLMFSDREVRLMLKQGQCIIQGKDFVIKTILPEEILLEGTIELVRYIES
ncbi:sporulation protein YqfC [Bacillus changyiensis]|uniref:sporulation protein YqfC n=1 Tax=Bacillus changyiensis TaxID=3004103 RepID=UPI0022DF913A|nr:sporulation protein YqfC [Bacillus changyiensis]MDA1474792.1 sporulation protein YqfC [Bacillus changyiensis]